MKINIPVLFFVLGVTSCQSTPTNIENGSETKVKTNCCDTFSQINYVELQENRKIEAQIDDESQSLNIDGFRSFILGLKIPEKLGTKELNIYSIRSGGIKVNSGGYFNPTLKFLDSSFREIKTQNNFQFGMYRWGFATGGPAIYSKVNIPDTAKYVVIYTTKQLLDGLVSHGWDGNNYYDVNSVRTNTKLVSFPWKYSVVRLPHMKTGKMWIFLGRKDIEKKEKI